MCVELVRHITRRQNHSYARHQTRFPVLLGRPCFTILVLACYDNVTNNNFIKRGDNLDRCTEKKTLQ